MALHTGVSLALIDTDATMVVTALSLGLIEPDDVLPKREDEEEDVNAVAGLGSTVGGDDAEMAAFSDDDDDDDDDDNDELPPAAVLLMQ